MPDTFDTDGQGTGDEDVFDPSTASGSDEDFLGTDGSPSKDQEATPPDSEDESTDAGTFLDENDRFRVLNDPEQGYEHIVGKVEKFVRGQHKTFTKRMQQLAAERAALKPKAQTLDAFNQRLQEIRDKGPEGAAWVQQMLEVVKGDRDMGKTASSTPSKMPQTVPELMATLEERMASIVQREIGGLKGQYSQDQATRDVDRFLKQVNNPKLTALRDRLIQTMSDNPGFKIKNALAVADPDLFADLTYEARRKREAPAGGARTESEFTTRAARPTLRNIDDALEAAWAEKGGLPPAQ